MLSIRPRWLDRAGSPGERKPVLHTLRANSNLFRVNEAIQVKTVRIARATGWNVIGLGTPALLALFCVPILIANVGKERFGLLSLLWAFLGTAALFDLGLGRAMTIQVSRRLSQNGASDVAVAVRSGLVVLALVGFSCATLIAAFSGVIVSFLKETTIPNVQAALVVAAPAVFLVVVSSGITCALEGFQRFEYSNIVRMSVGLGTIGGTTVASFFTAEITHLAAALMISRLLSTILGAVLLASLLKSHVAARRIRRSDLTEFMSFGRWITFGNLLNPLLAYGDRFVLSTLVVASEIAYYTVPFDILARVLIVPGAIGSSIFPRFSRQSDWRDSSRLLRAAALAVTCLTLPLLVVLAVVAHFALSLWISPDFAAHSFRIAQVLCVGVLFNGVAVIPFGFLQAQGHARQLAFVQLCEVPVYLIALYAFGAMFGALGVALSWSGRVLLDSILLWILALKVVRRHQRHHSGARETRRLLAQ